MSPRTTCLTFCCAVVLGLAMPAGAANPSPPAKREIIPGATLMTHAERERYRERMRKAPAPEDKARERGRHVREMQERAQRRGLTITDHSAAAGAANASRRKQ